MERNVTRLFAMFVEWCIAMTWVGSLTLFSLYTRDVTGFIAIGFTMLILVPLTYYAPHAKGLTVIWVCTATMVIGFLFNHSVSMFACPLCNLIFRHRLLILRDKNELQEAARSFYMIEMIFLPLLLLLINIRGVAATWLIDNLAYIYPTVPHLHSVWQFWLLPTSLLIVFSIAYIIFRLFTLLAYQNQRNSVLLFRSLSLLPAMVSTVLPGVLLYGIVEIWLLGRPPWQPQWRKGAPPPRVGGKAPPPPTTHRHSAPVVSSIPWWEWAIFFALVAAVAFIAWRHISRRRKMTHESVVVAEVRATLIRISSVPLQFLQTSSYIRKAYQEIIKIMHRVGRGPRQSETPKEFLMRVGALTEASQLRRIGQFENAYEAVRYSDAQESPQFRRLADEGLGVISESVQRTLDNTQSGR